MVPKKAGAISAIFRRKWPSVHRSLRSLAVHRHSSRFESDLSAPGTSMSRLPARQGIGRFASAGITDDQRINTLTDVRNTKGVKWQQVR